MTSAIFRELGLQSFSTYPAVTCHVNMFLDILCTDKSFIVSILLQAYSANGHKWFQQLFFLVTSNAWKFKLTCMLCNFESDLTSAIVYDLGCHFLSDQSTWVTVQLARFAGFIICKHSVALQKLIRFTRVSNNLIYKDEIIGSHEKTGTKVLLWS